MSDLDQFAIDCALDAAWYTQFWIPADPDYGFVDYFEAAAFRNLTLLAGLRDLGEDIERRGIIPQSEGDQARLVTDGGYQTPLVEDDRDDEEIETPLQITDDGLRLPEQFREETRLIFRTPTMTVDSRLNGQNTRRKKYFYAVSPGDYDEDYLAGEGRTAEIRNEKCLTDDGYFVGILPAGGEQHWLPVEIEDGDDDE